MFESLEADHHFADVGAGEQTIERLRGVVEAVDDIGPVGHLAFAHLATQVGDGLSSPIHVVEHDETLHPAAVDDEHL